MSLWEYKVITSGKGGFVSPALMEKFLNDLGKEEWEIIAFHTQPDNTLAFTGLARRSTQRDWTLADAAANAAKAEADKLRQEFEAKFKGMSAGGAAAEEKAESPLAEKAGPDDGLRRLVDTSHDDDPDAPDEEKDEWDKLGAEEELPTFFEAIRPHLRRNQRGPGMSVGTDYLAKKWDQSEDDIKGALVECGFALPEDEDAKPVYLEYDGDLYWLNINRRGELWLNTKEKPRPVFRAVQGQRVTVEEPEPAAQAERAEKPESGNRRPERSDRPKPEAEKGNGNGGEQSGNRNPQPEVASGAPLPTGPALLEKIRPMMRRNRRGPGGSGSVSFLARALKCSETDLSTAFTGLGLMLPATPNDKSVFVEIEGDLWWLNQDSRGGVWINGREKKEGETAASASAAEPAPEAAPAPASPAAPESSAALAVQAPESSLPKPNDTLVAVRLLLKETKTGAFAGKLERVAGELGKSPDDLLAALTGAGLKIPEKSREKPVFVEHAAEIFWLNKNAKDELWLNAKASKFAGGESDEAEGGESDEEGGKKPARRGGGRGKKKTESEGESA